MKFRVPAAAAAILMLLAVAGTASAAGCDVSVLFQTVNGKFDQGVLRRVNSWATSHPAQVASIDETVLDNGSRLLCLTAPPQTEVEPLFAAVRKELPRKTSRAGFIGLYSRTGQSARIPYESRRPGSGYSNGGRPPRDNGLPSRPPLGNRN